MAISISIFGSCVTRDAFSASTPEFLVREYIARSALGSAFADEPFPLGLDVLDAEDKITSKFQRRMVECDLKKEAGPILRQARPQSAALVVDFVDERFPLVSFDDKLGTLSLELRTAGALDRLPGAQVHDWTTDPHYTGFLTGIRRLKALAEEQGLPIILNRVFWAHRSSDGSAFKASWIDASNAQLERRYAAVAAELGIAEIRYPAGIFVSDASHRWTKAPFHYTPATYDHMRSELVRILRDGLQDGE